MGLLFFNEISYHIGMSMRIIALAVTECNTEIHIAFSQGEFCVGDIFTENVTVTSAVAVNNNACTG